jgi:hypothetical protein
MPDQPRKMSEIMKEMFEALLRNPTGEPSSEARMLLCSSPT